MFPCLCTLIYFNLKIIVKYFSTADWKHIYYIFNAWIIYKSYATEIFYIHIFSLLFERCLNIILEGIWFVLFVNSYDQFWRKKQKYNYAKLYSLKIIISSIRLQVDLTRTTYTLITRRMKTNGHKSIFKMVVYQCILWL